MKLYRTLRWICLLTGIAGCAGWGGRFKKMDTDRYAFIKKGKLEFEIKGDSLYEYQQR